MWHAMALETAGTFLPSECPLVSHIILSYQKHHSPALTTIPEDEPLIEDLKVVRPLNDIRNAGADVVNYHQIIRAYKRPGVPQRQALPNQSHHVMNLVDFSQAQRQKGKKAQNEVALEQEMYSEQQYLTQSSIEDNHAQIIHVSPPNAQIRSYLTN